MNGARPFSFPPCVHRLKMPNHDRETRNRQEILLLLMLYNCHTCFQYLWYTSMIFISVYKKLVLYLYYPLSNLINHLEVKKWEGLWHGMMTFIPFYLFYFDFVAA